MRIDSAGWPFIAIAAAPAAVSAGLGWLMPAAVLLVLPLAIAAFFRDPERVSPQDQDLVLSPADGKVMHAGAADTANAPSGAWRQITIFLSPLDVHINRTPVSGRVTRVEYHPGSFYPAYRHDAAKNERSEIWFDHGGQVVVARQVVGAMARRVVCRLKAGDDVAAGQRLGLMKFGSRMDIFVPLSAELLVTAGQMVRAGETRIARLAAAGAAERAGASA
jgi:phosphatidylserine decarboxylase